MGYLEEQIQNNDTQFKEHEFKGLTTGDALERALRNESLTVNAFKYAYDKSNDEPIDDTFDDKQKEVIWEENKHRINSGFKDYVFNRGVNKEKMYSLLDEYEEESKKQEYLESLGITGTLLNIGANIVDIPLYIAGIATAEVSAPVLTTALSTTALRRALVGGSVEGLFEFAKDNIGEKDRTAMDYTLGVIFGSGANALLRGDNLLADTSQRALKRILKSDELDSKLAKATTKEEKDNVFKEHLKNVDLDESKRKIASVALKDMEMDVKKGRLDEKVFNAFRTDLAYLTQTSPSATMQKMANSLFIDETLQSNKANKIGNAELADTIEQSLIDSSLNIFNEPLHAFAKAKGKNYVQTRFDSTRDEFSGILGLVQMRRNLFDISDEESIRYAKELLQSKGVGEQYLDDLSKSILKGLDEDAKMSHKILKDNGKAGFADGTVPENKKYMTIMYDKDMKNNLSEKGIDYKMFKDFIKESIVSNLTKKGTTIDDDILEELSNGISNGIWHNSDSLFGKADSIEDVLGGVLDSMAKNNPKLLDIKRKLYEPKEGYSKSESLDIYSKQRSPIDYSYKKSFIGSNGRENTLSFEDLVNKNYMGVKSIYSRKMGGMTALENTRFKVERIDNDKLNKLLESSSSLRMRTYSRTNELKEGLKSGDVIIDDLVRVLKPDATAEDIARLKDIIDINSVAKQLESVKIDEAYKELEQMFGKDITNRLKENAEAIGAMYKRAVADIHARGVDKEEFDRLFEIERARIKEEIRNSPVYDEYKKLSSYTEEVSLANKKDSDEVREMIHKELLESGVSKRKIDAELTRFDETVNELRGNPTSTDPFGTATQIQRIMKNLNIARLLGQTGITMTAELGSAVYHAGIKRFMEFSSFKDIVEQAKSGKINNQLTQEIQSHMGLGNELNRAIGGNRYNHEFNLAGMDSSKKLDSILDKAENISEKMTEATLLIGGVKPLTAWMEDVIAKDTINNIALVFGSRGALTKREIKDMNELGIDIDMINSIRNQFKKYGEFSEGTIIKGKKVHKINFDKWDDDDAKRHLINATRRITNTIIQKSTLGSKTGITYNSKLFRNNLFGKFALELKDYMITSYVKQLGRAINRRDAYVIGLLVAQVGALTLSTVMQNYANFSYNEKKLKESMKPEVLASNIFQKLPLSSIIPMVADTGYRSVTGEQLFQNNRYHSGVQSGILSLPSIDLLMKMEKVLNVPYNIATDKFGKQDINALFGIMPLGNTYGVRTGKEYLQNQY